MSNPVRLQRLLRTLRTAKKGGLGPPLLCQETLDLISQSSPPSSSSAPFFSELDLSSLHRILSDHYIPSSACLKLFNFLLMHPSSLSFEPDLLSHLILICRLLKATNFSEAEKLIKFISVDQVLKYPFPLIADEFKGCPCKRRTAAKFFNLVLQVYSDNLLFDEASMSFSYMTENQIQVNERTCTVHLLALNRCDEAKKCVEFFHRMLESGIPVSVYSLTAVVDGLCRHGEIKMGRELVEEMLRRGTVRPNAVTFNVLIAACTRRWNFEELELVLRLMEKEAVGFNLQTYKFLLDGFTSSGKVEEAGRLLVEMKGQGLRVDVHMYNLIINACGISGDMKSAALMFDEMTERGVRKNADTYRALINGLCKAGEMEAVKGYINEMQRQGIELEKVTLETVMEGFCRKGMVNAVPEIRLQMERSGYKDDSRMLSRERKARRLRKPSQKGRLTKCQRSADRNRFTEE